MKDKIDRRNELMKDPYVRSLYEWSIQSRKELDSLRKEIKAKDSVIDSLNRQLTIHASKDDSIKEVLRSFGMATVEDVVDIVYERSRGED